MNYDLYKDEWILYLIKLAKEELAKRKKRDDTTKR